MPDRSAKSFGGFIERVVTPDATIITDDWSGYAALEKRRIFIPPFFYPFNAFRFLLGIAGDVTAPTYAEFMQKTRLTTTSSTTFGSEPDKHDSFYAILERFK